MGEPAPTMQSTEETAPRARLVEVHTLAVEQLRDGTFQYMFQARWSDESVTSAQHSFETLYTTHCTLLDLYPEEAGSLDSPRLIPPFPGKKIAKGLTKGARNANAQVLAQKRLREIAAWAAGITAIASVANSREFVHLFDSEAALSSSTAASHGRAAESVTLVGFLVKQGGGHKGWKRRHCLLDDQGFLSYYLDEASAVASGQLDLGDAENCQLASEPLAASPTDGWPKEMRNDASGFTISMPGRTYFFFSDSTGEARQWTRSIQEAMRIGSERQRVHEAIPNVTMQGLLTKQGGSAKSWKQRFCIISQDGRLSYYTDKGMSNLKGELLIEDVVALHPGTHEPPYGWPEGVSADMGFAVQLPLRTYYFHAHSAALADSWRNTVAEAWRVARQRRETVRRNTMASRPDHGETEEGIEASTAELTVEPRSRPLSTMSNDEVVQKYPPPARAAPPTTEEEGDGAPSMFGEEGPQTSAPPGADTGASAESPVPTE